jgi:phosphoglycolate phosphatase-like HAD superfamily hydrolase
MRPAVFDMDGTLIDSMPGLTVLAVDNIVKYFGLRRSLAEYEYQRTVGRPYLEQLQYLFPDAPETVKLAEYEYAKNKRQITLEAPVLPFVRGILREIVASECPVGIISSTDRALMIEVVEKHFPNMFDWLGGYEPGQRKPDQVQTFMQSFEIKRSDKAWYFGDSDEDLRIAGTFDMQFVKVQGCLTFR